METNLPAPLRIHEYAAFPTAAVHSYAEVEQPAGDAPEVEAVEPPRYWAGVIGVEDQLTGDGRIIETDALEWETPIPLRFVKEDTGGHQGAVVVGRILSISRGDDGKIEAYGDFDHGSDDGREAARLVGAEMLNGVSMDLDSVMIEVRVDGDVIDRIEAEEEAFLQAIQGEEGAEPERPEREVATDGRVVVAKMGADDEVLATTGARVRAATMVSVPAFAQAMIRAIDALPEDAQALVASAAPVEPPREWFSDPALSAPTALTIDDSGRVYGHLASWDVCHVADPNGSGVCVMAPKSTSGYAYFHTGVVKTSEGPLVPTGVLRFDTQHASIRSNADSATAHYDHTGLGGADVHIGEDKHGIWVAGALRPGLNPEQVRTLRASPLSGDWRYVNGSLELVGALAVNLPGFPIPRTQGLVASGELQGLVAAGMVVAPEQLTAAKRVGLSASDATYLQRLVERERTAEHRALRSRAEAANGRRKIAAFNAKRALAAAASTTTSF